MYNREMLYLFYQNQNLINLFFNIGYGKYVINEFYIENYYSFREEINQICDYETYRSLYTYRLDLNACYNTFLSKLVKNKMISFFRILNTKKELVYKNSIYLDEVVEDNLTKIDLVHNNVFDFEKEYIYVREKTLYYSNLIYNKFGEKEYKVWNYKKEGLTYKKIAVISNLKERQVSYIINKITKYLKMQFEKDRG